MHVRGRVGRMLSQKPVRLAAAAWVGGHTSRKQHCDDDHRPVRRARARVVSADGRTDGRTYSVVDSPRLGLALIAASNRHSSQ